MAAQTVPAAVEAINVSKAFAGIPVLRDVSFSLQPGEVVGVVGANGSGKSTLVRVLTGVYEPSPGSRIRLGGHEVAHGFGPDVARRMGLRVVHQEAPVVASLTVAEVVGLHRGFPTAFGVIRRRTLARLARAVVAKYDDSLLPDRLIASLTGAQRAILSLAIALDDEAGPALALILDEATAALTTVDASTFLSRAVGAARGGAGVLMVTHRLAEVQDVCDRVLVLRDGQLVHEAGRGEMAPRDLIHHMVRRPGAHRVSSAEDRHEALASATPTAQTPGKAALELVDLVGSGLKASTLRLRPGEIVGVVGRRDGGSRALLRLVSGIDTPTSGNVFVDGVRLPSIRHPRFALRYGITYLSSDRDIEGGIASMSVRENLTLPTAGRYWRRSSDERRDAREMIDLLDIRPTDPNALFGRLSGGNQQKVLLGRWLLMPPRVLVLDDPTSGVDPTTRERIFETLRRLSGAGVAILFGSTEPEQLARLCSRVLVMRDGAVAEELSGPNLDTETISLASLE